jgi:3-oxoacyl-[acyl-carrier protein] reductase
VNCVVPGLVDTKRGASSGKPAHLHNPLLERRAKPQDVAAVVRLLAGPSGRSITGQDWHVNAGGYLG